MTASSEIIAAGRNEIASSGFRQALESLEKVILQAAAQAVIALLPGVVRVLLGGLLESLANKGIDAAVSFTDAELQKLHVDALGIAKQHLAAAGIVEFSTPDSDLIHTKADLEMLHPEVLKPGT